MMKTGLAAMASRLALVCITLFLVSGLAYPTAAGAQERGEDDIPEQLWKTYPLDPTKTDADAPETVPTQPSRPAQTETDSTVRTMSESPKAQAQPSGESDSGRSLTLLLLGALLSLLVGLLVIAAARSGAFAIGGGYLARGGSALEAPLRAASTAPRYVSRGGAVVVSPLRTLPGLVRRIGHLLLRRLRALAVVAAYVVGYVVGSVGTAVAAAAHASRSGLHEQRASLHRFFFFYVPRVLPYVLIVLVSAGAGLLITVLLQL
jgi:hypothetical protein